MNNNKSKLTAHNRSVYASPLRGSGFRSPRSVGLRLRSHGSLHPQFLALDLLRKPLSGLKTVVNSRNVRRNCSEK